MGIPFTNWEQFSGTVLAAVREYPEVMVPQLAEFLANQKEPGEDLQFMSYKFDPDASVRLFGGAREVSEAIGDHRQMDWSNYPAVQVMIKGVWDK
jgi:hypothetical protein